MDSIIIAKNIPLTCRLTAKEIWISPGGDVTIITSQFGPHQPVPQLTAGYLDSLCSKFYFGGKTRQTPIADILNLNGLLARSQYDDFYDDLEYNVNHGNLTVICSDVLFP